MEKVNVYGRFFWKMYCTTWLAPTTVPIEVCWSAHGDFKILNREPPSLISIPCPFLDLASRCRWTTDGQHFLLGDSKWGVCLLQSQRYNLSLMRAAQRLATWNLIIHMYSVYCFAIASCVKLRCPCWKLKILTTASCSVRGPLIKSIRYCGLIHLVMLSCVIFSGDSVTHLSMSKAFSDHARELRTKAPRFRSN